MRQDVIKFIQKVAIAPIGPIGTYRPTGPISAPTKTQQAGAVMGRLAGGITNPNHVPFSQFKPISAITPNHQTEFFKTQLPETAQNVLANQKVYSKPYPPKVYPVADLGSQKIPFTATDAYGVQWGVGSSHPDPKINARLQKEREVLFREMNPYMSNSIYPGDPNLVSPNTLAYAHPYPRDRGDNRNRDTKGTIAILPNNTRGDILGTLIHEIEHTNQILLGGNNKTVPRRGFNVELAPSLREAAFDAEAWRRAGLGTANAGYAFKPLISTLEDNYYKERKRLDNVLQWQQFAGKRKALYDQIDALSNQFDQDVQNIKIPYERIRAEAERHGVFDGRSMTDVLSRPEARQYFQRLYQTVDPTDSVATQMMEKPIQTDSVPVNNYQPKSWWQQLFSR